MTCTRSQAGKQVVLRSLTFKLFVSVCPVKLQGQEGCGDTRGTRVSTRQEQKLKPRGGMGANPFWVLLMPWMHPLSCKHAPSWRHTLKARNGLSQSPRWRRRALGLLKHERRSVAPGGNEKWGGSGLNQLESPSEMQTRFLTKCLFSLILVPESQRKKKRTIQPLEFCLMEATSVCWGEEEERPKMGSAGSSAIPSLLPGSPNTNPQQPGLPMLTSSSSLGMGWGLGSW